MTLRIDNIAAATNAQWDDALTSSPAATGFHARCWAEAWADATDGLLEPAPRLVTFSDGVTALLPLSIEHRRGALPRRFISSPGGTYGGWLEHDGICTPTHASLLVQFLCDDLPDLVWRTNPFDSLQSTSTIREVAEEHTHVLPLHDGFDALAARWRGSNSTWRKARKAARAGVSVRQADALDDWRAYFAIYQDTLTRWGDAAPTPHPWSFFERLAHGDPSLISLWLAEYGSTPVAGAICVHSHLHCAYWHGAASSEALGLRPVNLLHVEIIRAMCERGLHWYDFNPSGGHAGVERFKRSFGCDVLTTNVIINQSLRARAAIKLPRLLKRAS